MFGIVPALLGWYRWSRRRRVQPAPIRLAEHPPPRDTDNAEETDEQGDRSESRRRKTCPRPTQDLWPLPDIHRRRLRCFDKREFLPGLAIGGPSPGPHSR